MTDTTGTTIISSDSIYLANYNIGSDTTIDSSTSIQAAINDALAGKKPLVFPSNIKLRVDFQLVADLNSTNSLLVIKGNNSILYPSFDGPCLKINPTTKIEDANGQEIVHFEIDGLNFDGFFQTENTRALHIGRNGYALDDFSYSIVKNMLLQNFTKQHPILIEGTRTRHILFDSIVSRDNGFQVLSANNDGFVGDMTFRNCETHFKNGGKGCLDFFVSAPVSTTQLRGIRFESCVFYGGKLMFGAGAFGQFADVWMDNCAMDQGIGTSKGIVLNGSGGQFHQFFIEDLYAVGFNGNIVNAELNSQSSLTSNGLVIRGGNISLNTVTPIKIKNFRGVSIDGVNFSDISGSYCIELARCYKSIIVNNIHSDINGLKPMYIVSIDAVSKDVSAKNNIGDVSSGLILDLQPKEDVVVMIPEDADDSGTIIVTTASTGVSSSDTDGGSNNTNLIIGLAILLLVLLLSSSSAAAFLVKK